MRLCVVGFGLIGGSVAAAARAKIAGAEVVAVDRAEVVASERARQLAQVGVALEDDASVERELGSADLVVLAAPVSAIEAMLPRALERARLVTDCGSTKRSIVARAERSPARGRFVAGHPLAGGSAAGAALARADLFEQRSWILCPDGSDDDAFASVLAFVRSLGAAPVSMSAAEHDHAVALTSHLPQLLASALVALAERHHAEAARGTGFFATTRVAGGNPEVWRDILATNADEVAGALRELGAELARVAAGLEAGDVEPALSLIRAARRSSAAGRSE